MGRIASKTRTDTPNVVVVGAGVGGLTAAAELARAGLNVTVLEAHVYPGGCAGTFYHRGYRFDAGATLSAGFYPGGPMDMLAKRFDIRWPARATERAMVAHLPDSADVTLWTDHDRWQDERIRWFGKEAEPFWQWQERTADALWNLALRLPAWPPQSLSDARRLVRDGLAWLTADMPAHVDPRLALDAFRSVAAHLPHDEELFRLFIDAQLLIAAQTTSEHANALYGASALDLPRRGVAHLEGGMGAIADQLVDAVRRLGGNVQFRQEVTRVVTEHGRPVAVETNRDATFDADWIFFNLPPWNIVELLGDTAPERVKNLPPRPEDGWGAFMVYAGIDASAVPADAALHHQLVVRRPLAEGNTLFLSLSPSWDHKRAPEGKRALTISTHTELAPWWQRFERDREAYEARKDEYTQRILQDAEQVFPGFRDAADLVLPGTPVTFRRFTRREWGWVGGFPQRSLFRAWGPQLDAGMWLVGDSIFPGQSVPAVALGGLRVARDALTSIGAAQSRRFAESSSGQVVYL